MSPIDPARRLSELIAVCDRIGSNLFELDGHPTVEFLRVSDLTGDTATRWRVASGTIGHLFAAHATLRAVLDRAARVNREISFVLTRNDELRKLLDGPSIVTADDLRQLADRSLGSSSRVVMRSTPDDLIAAMTADFDEVRAFVVSVDRIWTEMLPALREARRREVELEDAPGDSDAIDPDVEDVRRQLRTLSEDVLSDPLSVDAQRLREIDARLDAAERELSELRDFREHRDQHLDDARQLLSDARQAVRTCEESVCAVRSRIVLDGAIEAPSLPASVDDELMLIAESDEAVHSLAERLARWREEVSGCRGDADRTRSACQSLLAERDELRARLEAYHAKAADLGQIEHEQLARAHEHARTVLFTAPTDLAVARRAVGDYQHLLASSGVRGVRA